MAVRTTPGSNRLRAVCVLCAAVAVLALPVRAQAQQTVFVQALAELTSAIEGTIGDEGARLAPALDALAAALAAWDREIDAAEASLRAVAPDAPLSNAVERRVALGRVFADRGRLADALAEFTAAVSLDPRRLDVHVLRGLALHESGRTAEAIAAFRAARAIDPGNTAAAYYLFRELAISGDAEGVRDAASAVAAAYRRLSQEPLQAGPAPFARLALLPSDPAAPPVVPIGIYRQAFGHIQRGEYERAVAEFRRGAANDPLVTDSGAGSPSLYAAVGALRQGRLAEARSLLAQSGPAADSSEVHRVRGLVHWAGSDYDNAIAALTTAIQRSPRNERARLALARVLSAAGRDADAEQVLEATSRLLPESARARWWLASAYERVNKFADARRELEAAAAAAVSGQSQLHGAVGRLASGAADFPVAIAAFQRAVYAEPNDAAMHRLLAQALVQQDRAGEAVAEFVAALLIDPMDAAALAGIGHVHLNAGRHAEAADLLRRALDLSPASIETRHAFAQALARLGRTNEAAQHFTRVEQAQRQMLDDRRRQLSADVLKEEAALRSADANENTAR